MVAQLEGVANALGVAAELKVVAPTGIWRHLAPWGPIAPSERFGEAGTPFAPPWPKLAIACGRQSIPYIRALRRGAGAECYTVVLQDPRTGADTADLIWVPAHDKRRGANVMATVLSPHRLTIEDLEGRRHRSHHAIDLLPTPRIAVILGGRTKVYPFREDDLVRLSLALGRFAERGASFLITASRRTHADLLRAVDDATSTVPRILWRNEADGANPYADFLAKADAFVITADSVNMTGEACATGRPIHVFHPEGGSRKFTTYHQSLEAMGATRPLDEASASVAAWSYTPKVATETIAREIEARIARR